LEDYKALLISDFTIDNLSGYLNNNKNKPIVKSKVAPYDQVTQVLLLDYNQDCWEYDPDIAVVWTTPERAIKSFLDKLEYKDVKIDTILKEVDEYSSMILNIIDRVKFVFIPTWVLPNYIRGFGALDMKHDFGIENILMQMNLKLSENLGKSSNVYILNTRKWIENVGRDAFNSKTWYIAKIPFDNKIFKEAIVDIKSALDGITGNSKKLIIVDLDDTLWGGVVGDIGWENIKLGGHDQIGEAYKDFQSSLKSFINRGIILGVVSKNEESVGLDAIDNNPEMLLKREHFSGWRINWEDKAQNIADLVEDLNLGLQSVVFIDDNPVERARVREALPDVFVPDWPDDPRLYKAALLSLNCFDIGLISEEDLKRTKMYVSDRKRQTSRNNISSLDEWLKSLEINVVFEELNEMNLRRTTQLFNKTNQMNLSTRRLSENEIVDWVGKGNHYLWVFRVSDKFGDSGLTGITSIEIDGEKGRIIDFILSCRVFGRKIEETMIHHLVKFCSKKDLNSLVAKYVLTKKNKPCFEFWRNSGFTYDKKKNLFFWDFKKSYPLPININYKKKL